MKPIDLKEMDLVVRRDGMLCWVLYNSVENELCLFHYSLFAQHVLSNYFDDFTYGKDVKHYNKDRDSQNDIIAVIRPKTYWYTINAMRTYETNLQRHLNKDETKEERILDFLKNAEKWNWVWFSEGFKKMEVIDQMVRHSEYMLTYKEN